ncbi:MAG: hypothetical protein Q9162_003865 [Coniocarpon cinnabarinum]
MTQSASSSARLIRRFAHKRSSPTLFTPSATPVRAFTTTLPTCKTPSLTDVTATNAGSFEDAQAQFREHLRAHRAQRDRKSPTTDNTATAASNAEELASAKAQTVEQALNSPTILGEAREAARAAHETSSAPSSSENGAKEKRRQSMVSRLIHGTEEGRLHEKELEQSFSQVLARGKYVHSITFHTVKPDRVDEYTELIGNFYPRAANDPSNKVKLVGSWRTEVGDADTFVHIWEYERYHGFHSSLNHLSQHPDYPAYASKLSNLITHKHLSLMQEFSFWPTSPPRTLGGLFELRSYKLHPGNLLEWETHWRKGLDARKQVMEGVGAWFVQIGDLNTVHHLWQFANLEERKVRREQSWAIEGWGDTVHKTVPLIQEMQSRILVPCEWSPIA